MPKVTLKFDLPEEQVEFEEALQGIEWKSSMRQLDDELRQRVEYGVIHPEYKHGLETARELLLETLGEFGLELFE